MKHSDITDKISGAFYKVYNTLGYGFLKKVYENAMKIELEKCGFMVQKQMNLKVWYDGKVIGDYYADLCVNNQVIVELKAAETLRQEHELQLINYLKATDVEIGLLLNFGKEAQFKRKIYSNKNQRRSARSAESAFYKKEL